MLSATACFWLTNGLLVLRLLVHLLLVDRLLMLCLPILPLNRDQGYKPSVTLGHSPYIDVLLEYWNHQ